MDSVIIGRALLIFAGVIAVVGLGLLLLPRLPFVGHLPGDISFQRGGFSLYAPIATSIIVSIVLTIAINVAIRVLHK